MDAVVHVAVGVIINDKREVLISRRADRVHQGGLWEFPGGKVEADETVQQALARELREELSLQLLESIPLMQVRHDYGDKKVLLDVWQASQYSGEATGLEGQPVRWVPLIELPQFQFPAANIPILEKLLAQS